MTGAEAITAFVALFVVIDPIGLALDNFDVTGRWRTREHGTYVDVRGELYDGTPLESPADLTQALVARPTPVLRNFALNLMAYALGRRVEYYDMPAIRQLVDDAEEEEYRITAFIHGVVQSDAFRMRQAPAAATDADEPAR